MTMKSDIENSSPIASVNYPQLNNAIKTWIKVGASDFGILQRQQIHNHQNVDLGRRPWSDNFWLSAASRGTLRRKTFCGSFKFPLNVISVHVE